MCWKQKVFILLHCNRSDCPLFIAKPQFRRRNFQTKAIIFDRTQCAVIVWNLFDLNWHDIKSNNVRQRADREWWNKNKNSKRKWIKIKRHRYCIVDESVLAFNLNWWVYTSVCDFRAFQVFVSTFCAFFFSFFCSPPLFYYIHSTVSCRLHAHTYRAPSSHPSHHLQTYGIIRFAHKFCTYIWFK